MSNTSDQPQSNENDKQMVKGPSPLCDELYCCCAKDSICQFQLIKTVTDVHFAVSVAEGAAAKEGVTVNKFACVDGGVEEDDNGASGDTEYRDAEAEDTEIHKGGGDGTKGGKDGDEAVEELSKYELERLERIERNRKIFRDMGITEANADLRNVVQSRKSQASKIGRIDKKKSEKNEMRLRKRSVVENGTARVSLYELYLRSEQGKQPIFYVDQALQKHNDKNNDFQMGTFINMMSLVYFEKLYM